MSFGVFIFTLFSRFLDLDLLTLEALVLGVGTGVVLRLLRPEVVLVGIPVLPSPGLFHVPTIER